MAQRLRVRVSGPAIVGGGSECTALSSTFNTLTEVPLSKAPNPQQLPGCHSSGPQQLQWGKKVFSQPPIVQVLPLKKMREACNFHHRYTSTMRDKIRKKKSRKSHCRIFKEFICKLWWKISIWSPKNKQDCWLSQTCNFFFKRLLCPPLVTCINGICLNSLSV